MTSTTNQTPDAQNHRPETTPRDQFLTDVFVTAIEGGITYWATIKSYHWCTDRSDPLNSVDYAGFYSDVVADDDETGEVLRIDRKVIEAGLRSLAEPVGGLDEEIRRRILLAIGFDDAGDLDAGDADIIVQAGLFHEVVYG